MEPLDPKLRQLIDEGLPAAMPDSGAEGRGLAALLAEIDAPPPLPPAAAPAIAGLTKLVLAVAAAAGVIGAVGWVATQPEPTQQPTPTLAGPRDAPLRPEPVTPPPVSQPKAVPVAAPEPEPRAPARRHAPKPAHGPAPAPKPSPTDALRAEADLIARAESALDRDKPREALALCDMHRDGFEAPQLTTEREAIAASAACLLDPKDTAAAAAFVRAHPGGALTTKVRLRCGLEKAPAP